MVENVYFYANSREMLEFYAMQIYTSFSFTQCVTVDIYVFSHKFSVSIYLDPTHQIPIATSMLRYMYL